jgi:hypothetical protein
MRDAIERSPRHPPRAVAEQSFGADRPSRAAARKLRF